jgi:hypothetical protein
VQVLVQAAILGILAALAMGQGALPDPARTPGAVYRGK